jgi:sarcosine oxidase subunit delta
MFRIPCPHCGLRNVSEFRHVGEHRARPDAVTATPAQWRAYLYEQSNVADWSVESWYHTFGCRRFISVERHTVTNETRPVPEAPDPGQVGAGSASADSGAPDADSTS